jgi:hypothetical protein
VGYRHWMLGRTRLTALKCVLAMAVVMITVVVAFVLYSNRHREDHPGLYDRGIASLDLETDKRIMWETEITTHSAAPHAKKSIWSTDRAINAASRVFNRRDRLLGLTRRDVILFLEEYRVESSDASDTPFFPRSDDDVITYRFDSGRYGWQFDLHFDQFNRLHLINRRWIH